MIVMAAQVEVVDNLFENLRLYKYRIPLHVYGISWQLEKKVWRRPVLARLGYIHALQDA